MPKVIYTVSCKDFILSAANVNQIFFNTSIRDFDSNYDSILCSAFGQNFSGCFNLKDREKEPTKKGQCKIYIYCGCKEYRLIYNARDVMKDSELKFIVTTKTDAECICAEKPAKTRDVHGELRDEFKKQMERKTNKQVRNDAIDCSEVSIALAGNLQLIKKPEVIRKIRQELLGTNDKAADDIFDLQLRAECGNIQNLALFETFPSFSAILTKDDWLRTWIEHVAYVPYGRLLIDATGNITRKPRFESSNLLHHVLLAPIKKVDELEECQLFPIAELITNNSTSFNINKFLRFIIMRIKKKFPKTKKLADEIGTDFSFANINAIVNLNNEMTLKEYLDHCFQVFELNEISEMFRNFIIPILCFSHITKNIKQDINKFYNTTERRFIAALLGEIVEIEKVDCLDKYIKNVIVIIGSSNCDERFEKSKRELAEHFNFVPDDDLSQTFFDEDAEIEVAFNDDKTIYKSSKFYQHFKAYADTIVKSGTDLNKFFNDSFLKTLLKKYLAFLPLWTTFISKLRHKEAKRSNNARIERYFQGLKKDVKEEHLKYGEIGCVKVGRYIAFQEIRIDRSSKEIVMKANRITAPRSSRTSSVPRFSSSKRVPAVPREISAPPILKNPKKSCSSVSLISTRKEKNKNLTEEDLQLQREEWKKSFRKNNRTSAVFLNKNNLRDELQKLS